jgi:hypothetical protein
MADEKERLQRQKQISMRRRQLEHQRQNTQAQLAILQMQLEVENAEFDHLTQEEQTYELDLLQDKESIAQWRQSN